MDVELWKQRKKEKHLSYDELSAIAKIPRRTIVSIFMGETPTPRIDTIQAIEKALGIDNTGINIVNPLTDKERRLLDAFNLLIPPMQNYIIEMIEKLTEQEQNVRSTK